MEPDGLPALLHQECFSSREVVSQWCLGTNELAKRSAVSDNRADYSCCRHCGPGCPRSSPSRAPQHFSWTHCSRCTSRGSRPLLCLGAGNFGDPRCSTATRIRHSGAVVCPPSRPPGSLAVLAGSHSGGLRLGFVLRRLDPLGKYRNRLGMAAGNWSIRLRADVGKHSLSGFCRLLSPGGARTVFSGSTALSQA